MAAVLAQDAFHPPKRFYHQGHDAGKATQESLKPRIQPFFSWLALGNKDDLYLVPI